MNILESIPKAGFALKYNDISVSDVVGNYPVTNSVGTINATRTQATWFSINLEQMLGEMYNKYEMFNLRLNCVSYQQQAAFGVAPFDRLIQFGVSGLAWENNNYNTLRKMLTNESVLGILNFQENVAVTEVFDNSFVATFRKQKTCNITIQLETLDGNVPALDAGEIFPRISWFFDIIPVELDKTKA
jgi:hypothetical protein